MLKTLVKPYQYAIFFDIICYTVFENSIGGEKMGGLSLFFIALTALISIGFPIVMIIYFKRNYNASLLYLVVGALVFTIFQLLIRIPLLNWLGGQFWFYTYIVQNEKLYIVILALTAGIFEEIGRYVAFKFLLVDKREWENGVIFGIGHGGVESIILVGVNYLAFILISLHLNFGLFENIVGLLPNIDTVTPLLQETAPTLYLLAGMERLFTIIIHIGLSLLVLGSVRVGKVTGLIVAIGLHTLLNVSILLISSNIWIVEGIIGIGAILSIIYIHRKKSLWKFVI